MKLIIAIVRDHDESKVISELVAQNFRVTRMSSTGGFLRRGNVTLMVGTEEPKVDLALETINRSCQQPEPGQHKATIFVVNAVHFEQT
jgi:uncharacterized protein YaaQ